MKSKAVFQFEVAAFHRRVAALVDRGRAELDALNRPEEAAHLVAEAVAIGFGKDPAEAAAALRFSAGILEKLAKHAAAPPKRPKRVREREGGSS